MPDDPRYEFVDCAVCHTGLALKPATVCIHCRIHCQKARAVPGWELTEGDRRLLKGMGISPE